MKLRTQLIKDALVLAPAIYGIAIWVYFLSPWASLQSAPTFLILAVLLAFGVAYSIRLFIDALFTAPQAVTKKEIPNGAIQAVSSSATTTSGFGIAFLGFWAFGTTSGKNPWLPEHYPVLGLGLLAFVLLALVPLIASGAQAENRLMNVSRWCYGIGSSVLFSSIALAVYRSI